VAEVTAAQGDRQATVVGDEIEIRRLTTHDELAEAVAIQDEIWGAGFSDRVPAAILHVSQKVGGVTAGAFDATTGRMLGFVFGLTGFRDGRPIHWSDMLAVREEARGRHLGERLKRFQRDELRRIGVEIMYWTYDPLVARNAHFNINRLGARPVEYVPNMYGTHTGSTLHGSIETDRFIAAWDLREGAARPGARVPPGIPVVNPTRPDGTPSLGTLLDLPQVRVEIPHDIEALVASAPAVAAQWRVVTRAALLHYLQHGYDVTGFSGEPGAPGSYLLTKGSARRGQP
jgi:predicted GNAT superfamily acetyltransferase